MAGDKCTFCSRPNYRKPGLVNVCFCCIAKFREHTSQEKAAPTLLEASRAAEQFLSRLATYANDGIIRGLWIRNDILNHKIEQLRAAIASAANEGKQGPVKMADTEKMLQQAFAELRQQECTIRYQTRRILDIQRYESECFELRQQRDELLEACKALLLAVDSAWETFDLIHIQQVDEACDQASAAIASVTEK